MNIDTERKLDELLAKLPKRDYDLDAWLNEDETAEFDRIVNLSQRRKRTLWRWVAAAACLLITIGMGVTMNSGLKDQQAYSPGQHPEVFKRATVALKGHKQNRDIKLLPFQGDSYPLLLSQGAALGCKLVDLSGHFTGEGYLTPADGKAMAAPGRVVAAPRKDLAQTSQQDSTADTLGSSIWQRKENVVLALQMLSDCEQTIRREEQELRNDIIRATFNATPQPAKARLLLNDNGDYMVVEDNGPVIIEL